MLTPMDAVLDGMGFDERGQWHQGTMLDIWRWSFSDLGDESLKGMAADLLSRMLLGVGPMRPTMHELEMLRRSSLMAMDAWPAGEVPRHFDA